MVKNKTKKRSLKEAMLSEQVVEQQPQSSQDFTPPSSKPISLDQIVDRYIVRYERESIPLEGQGLPQAIDEAADIKKLVAFLLEQAPPPPVDEEEPDPNDPATTDPAAAQAAPDAAAEAPPDPAGGLGDMGGGGDMGGMGGDEPAPDAGGGGEPPKGVAVMNTPALNVNNFCRAAARLLNNFDVLLNPKTIINNRIEAYIRANYDDRTAKYYLQVMERNYSIKSTSSEYPESDDNSFPEPYSGLPGAGGGQG